MYNLSRYISQSLQELDLSYCCRGAHSMSQLDHKLWPALKHLKLSHTSLDDAAITHLVAVATGWRDQYLNLSYLTTAAGRLPSLASWKRLSCVDVFQIGVSTTTALALFKGCWQLTDCGSIETQQCSGNQAFWNAWREA